MSSIKLSRKTLMLVLAKLLVHSDSFYIPSFGISQNGNFISRTKLNNNEVTGKDAFTMNNDIAPFVEDDSKQKIKEREIIIQKRGDSFDTSSFPSSPDLIADSVHGKVQIHFREDPDLKSSVLLPSIKAVEKDDVQIDSYVSSARESLDEFFSSYLSSSEMDNQKKKLSDMELLISSSSNDDDDTSNNQILSKALHEIGFIRESKTDNVNGDDFPNDEIIFKWMNPCQAIRTYSIDAYTYRGTDRGINALSILGMLTKKTVSYDFESSHDDGNLATSHGGSSNLISQQKKILPESILEEITAVLGNIKQNGWLSTNLDSVDGLPSLHINLVSDGKPLFSTSSIDTEQDTFEDNIRQLQAVLHPYLYETLLPRAQKLTNSTTLKISDVFIRNYGENVQPDAVENTEEEFSNSNSRFGISAHYDIYSSLTSVIALDNVASKGDAGLFTVLNPLSCTSLQETENDDEVGVSNHASLRRYFPLNAGDGVLHSWDVLHGVDIDASVKRSSLIVWFTDYGENNVEKKDGEEGIPPWLLSQKDNCRKVRNDIHDFVLATTLSSKSNNNDADTERTLDLFLKSASTGNSFALNKLGFIFSPENDAEDFEPLMVEKTIDMLRLLSSSKKNPFMDHLEPIKDRFDKSNDHDDESIIPISYLRNILSKALWFESATRGNISAQQSLADSLMEMYTMIDIPLDDDDDDSKIIKKQHNDLILTAALFFVMAAQQEQQQQNDGYSLSEPLQRLISVYLSQFEHDEIKMQEAMINHDVPRTIYTLM